MAMVGRLGRSGARETVVLSSDRPVLPPEMIELWASGFRTYLTLVTEEEERETELRRWLDEARGVAFVQLLELPLGQVIEGILTRYTETYPEDRRVIRIRDHSGSIEKVDITDADEPNRPIWRRTQPCSHGFCNSWPTPVWSRGRRSGSMRPRLKPMPPGGVSCGAIRARAMRPS